MLASIGLVLRLGKRSDATTTYAPQVHTTLSEEVPVSSAMLRPPRVPESAEGRALVEQGYLRTTDIVPILGVTIQRVSQIIAEREDFPRPAENEACGGRCATGVATSSDGVASSETGRLRVFAEGLADGELPLPGCCGLVATLEGPLSLRRMADARAAGQGHPSGQSGRRAASYPSAWQSQKRDRPADGPLASCPPTLRPGGSIEARCLRASRAGPMVLGSARSSFVRQPRHLCS